MKALTIWQPWASLIVAGAKPYEFRSWKPPRSLIGQRIAIHAGARKMQRPEIHWLLKELAIRCIHADIARPILERALNEPNALPLSHVVCTAILGEPKSGAVCAQEFGMAGNDSEREGTFNWGWPLTDIIVLEPPEPARGAQGFWNWSNE
jgi:hypothetical protein